MHFTYILHIQIYSSALSSNTRNGMKRNNEHKNWDETQYKTRENERRTKIESFITLFHEIWVYGKIYRANEMKWSTSWVANASEWSWWCPNCNYAMGEFAIHLKISFPFRGYCLALNWLAESARYWQQNGKRFSRNSIANNQFILFDLEVIAVDETPYHLHLYILLVTNVCAFIFVKLDEPAA